MSISFSLLLSGVVALAIEPLVRVVSGVLLSIMLVLLAVWLAWRIAHISGWLRQAANIRKGRRPGPFPWGRFIDMVVAYDLWWGHLNFALWLFDGNRFFTTITAMDNPWAVYARLLASAVLTVQGTGFLLATPKFWVSELAAALAVKLGQFLTLLVLGSVAAALVQLG